MQIKTTMRYHLIPVRMAIIKTLQTINAGEGVEKREPSCTVGGNVNWYSHYGEQYGGSLKNIRISHFSLSKSYFWSIWGYHIFHDTFSNPQCNAFSPLYSYRLHFHFYKRFHSYIFIYLLFYIFLGFSIHRIRTIIWRQRGSPFNPDINVYFQGS